MSEWQPIETAPKERGARILGWCVYPMGAEARICVNCPPYLSDSVRWEAHGCGQNITHWQPLPEPPTPTE